MRGDNPMGMKYKEYFIKYNRKEKQKYFRCYSKLLHKYLEEHGFHQIYTAIDDRLRTQYYVYNKSSALYKAIDYAQKENKRLSIKLIHNKSNEVILPPENI
jgi:hypothetical protein